MPGSAHEIVEVPFETVGNRQRLTDRQLAEQPWLADFILRFQSCFERDEYQRCYWYYPEGMDAT